MVNPVEKSIACLAFGSADTATSLGSMAKKINSKNLPNNVVVAFLGASYYRKTEKFVEFSIVVSISLFNRRKRTRGFPAHIPKSPTKSSPLFL
jgi:hypothetical protein